MPELSASNVLVLLMTAMLVWVSVNVLLAVIRLNRSYELAPNRFIYPANCKPELCLDPLGFIRFISPRLIAFGVLGLIAGGLSQIGDLVASLVKRHCGIKDFGNIFPGHGGMLDRMDGILFCGVACYVFFKICGL